MTYTKKDGDPTSTVEIKLPFSKLASSENIAEELDEDQLRYVGNHVCEWYEKDENSRSEWKEKTQDALKLALQVMETKSYPWPNAANIKFPLLTIASLQFSARVYPALIKAPDLVKYRIVGTDPQGKKASKAARIGKYMSYQLLEEQEGWEEEQDKLFIALPILGCVFKKTFYDTLDEKVCSKMVLPQDLVVHYYTQDLNRSRATHVFELYGREVKEKQLRGLYIEYPEATEEGTSNEHNSDERQGIMPPDGDEETPRKFLECHCFWDFDGDGYAEPYVVTVDYETKYPLRIKHRFKEIVSEQSLQIDQLRKQNFAMQNALPPPQVLQQAIQTGQISQDQLMQIQQKAMEYAEKMRENQTKMQALAQEDPDIIRIAPKVYFTKYSFIPAPDGGYYDLGFGQLLGPINSSVNTIINQLVDSGTLQNGSSGFIGKGARIKGGRMRFEPFEWKQVQVAGATLKDSLVPLPVNAPSPVLFQLLGMLVQYAERIGSVSEIMQGENPGQNTPAYNMQAMLQQGLQVFNGVFKRIYRSFRSELRKIYDLNGEFLDPEKYVETMDDAFQILQEDFQGDPKDLIPAADPNAFSNMEAMTKAQFLASRMASVPGYNSTAVEKRLLMAFDIPDVDEVFPLNPDGSLAIPPPPNPELEIEKADVQRRTLEGRARAEKDAAVAHADIELKEAQILQIMHEIQSTGNEVVEAELKIKLEKMNFVKEMMLAQMDIRLKEMDMIIAQKKVEAAKEAAKAPAPVTINQGGGGGGSNETAKKPA